MRHLFQIIKVKDDRKRKGFKLINLFEEADAEQDDNGLWQITLTCTSSAREYVFNIENLGYLRYRLKNVINLTSRYSYVLFLYLLDNRFRKVWNIDLVELKALLNCTADRYKQFKFFNAEILKKCQRELCEKTDIRFSYKPIKSGRKVIAISFSVETIVDKISPVVQTLPDIPLNSSLEDNYEVNYGSELADLLGSAACDDEFTPEQIRVIQDLVIRVFPYSTDHMAMCDYLIRKVHKMNYYQPQSEKRFTYLCKMIESDINN